jgi:hypothetical protein
MAFLFQRIERCVIGRNGAGKSTLLKILVANADRFAANVLPVIDRIRRAARRHCVPLPKRSLLWSFERSDELQSIQVSHAGITRVRQFPTDGQTALQPFERSQIEFSLARVRTDWRSFGALALDVTIPSNEPIGFSIEVQDARGATAVARTKRDLGPTKRQLCSARQFAIAG